MTDRFNILALSGGGARGIYTARVLAEIENRFNKPVADSVDIICGTSIGGILALALALEIPANRILEKFNDKRLKIFPAPTESELKSPWFLPKRWLPITNRDLHRIKKSQYDPAPLRELLTEMFEDACIRDLKHCVIVPAINYTTGTLRAFKTPHGEDFFQDSKRSLVDVGLATSAAPTYFPNHVIDDARYVDGGIAVNNPVLMGVIEAHKIFNQDFNDVHALCIGNMGTERAANHEKPIDLGYKGWGFGTDIIDLSTSIGEQLSYHMAKMLLKDKVTLIDTKPTHDQAHLMKLDNASDEAASILKAQAEQQAGSLITTKEVKDFFGHKAKDHLDPSSIQSGDISNAKV